MLSRNSFAIVHIDARNWKRITRPFVEWCNKTWFSHKRLDREREDHSGVRNVTRNVVSKQGRRVVSSMQHEKPEEFKSISPFYGFTIVENATKNMSTLLSSFTARGEKKE